MLKALNKTYCLWLYLLQRATNSYTATGQEIPWDAREYITIWWLHKQCNCKALFFSGIETTQKGRRSQNLVLSYYFLQVKKRTNILTTDCTPVFPIGLCCISVGLGVVQWKGSLKGVSPNKCQWHQYLVSSKTRQKHLMVLQLQPSNTSHRRTWTWE